MYTLILDIAYFMNQPDIIIKTILIGDAGVGKTSLAKKLTNVGIKNDEISTIGVDFFNLDAIINKKKIRMHIWDTAGNEKFIHLVKSYFRNNAICYIVYDVCNYNSFVSVQKWINTFRNNSYNPHTLIVILANKTDNIVRRKVSVEEGRKLAEKNNAMYFEVSSKTSVGIDNFKNESLIRLLELYKNNYIISSDNTGLKYLNLEKNNNSVKKCCIVQ